jgi:5'-methylthioadenosine phosphorylase
METAEIGLIGGTGLYEMSGLEDLREIEVDTPFGPPSSTIRVGTLAGRRIAFLSRHGPGHRLLPSEIPYRANVYAFKWLGVSKVFSSSAVGSLREELPPRTLVVPDQYVDRTRHRVDTFFGDGIVAHVSLADPCSAAMRRALLDAAQATGQSAVDGGTYVCMEGPQFSTRAESLAYRAQGWHLIGMTSLTEARLCREAEIAYGNLCLVTDFDAWRPHESVDTAEILTVLRENSHRAEAILQDAVARVPAGPLPENRVLAAALVTPVARIGPEVRARLAAILAPYLTE